MNLQKGLQKIQLFGQRNLLRLIFFIFSERESEQVAKLSNHAVGILRRAIDQRRKSV